MRILMTIKFGSWTILVKRSLSEPWRFTGAVHSVLAFGPFVIGRKR